MKFARWTFRAAGIYGLVALLPQFFLEKRIGIDSPPAITHPEYFYGFLWVTVAWQVAFLVIGSDPVRFRPLMPVAILEKVPYALTMYALFAGDRVRMPVAFFATIDVALALLFFLAWRRTAAGRSMEA